MTWNTDLRALSQEAPPPFHDDKLSLLSWWKDSLFLHSAAEHSKDVTVDLNHIRGHAQGYPPMSWEYMLNNLKRIKSALKLVSESPQYYKGALDSSVSFCELDGQLFIDSGKHRTTIARYLAYYNPHQFADGPLLHGVTVRRLSVNHSLMDQVQRISSKLKDERFQHLKLTYLKKSFCGPARFILRNDYRNYALPLVYDEGGIDKLEDLLTQRGFLGKGRSSNEATYIKRPFFRFLSGL